MKDLPVHWYEGLFLRPQHLQSADRSWAERVRLSQQWDLPYNYGLHALHFSEEALANHHFEAEKLQARMPDGELINLDLGQEPDRVDLRADVTELSLVLAQLEEAFQTEAVVRVYVGVPKLRAGRQNVSPAESPGNGRYVETKLNVQDESWGGNDQEIVFRALNVRLLLSTQDLSGYDLLPIAQIKRAGEGEAKPQLDRSYIPPVLSIDAWPPLGRDVVRSLYDMIGQKIDVLSQQLTNRGIGLESNNAGDVDRIMMLTQLNVAYGRLAVLTFAQGVHPFTAYTELCEILARLSIFSPQRRVTDIPPYNHEELAPIFHHVRDRIVALINSIRDYQYQQRYFVGVGMGMQVSLEPQWFNSDWQWYIGVSKGDLNDQECRSLLSAGHLDWKLGSARQVEFLFQNRAEGLELNPVDRTVRALPARKDWVYYEVPKREAPAWRDVQQTQTLAMRLKDSLIINRDRLQGQQEIVVQAFGRTTKLQFALFAVPDQA